MSDHDPSESAITMGRNTQYGPNGWLGYYAVPRLEAHFTDGLLDWGMVEIDRAGSSEVLLRGPIIGASASDGDFLEAHFLIRAAKSVWPVTYADWDAFIRRGTPARDKLGLVLPHVQNASSSARIDPRSRMASRAPRKVPDRGAARLRFASLSPG